MANEENILMPDIPVPDNCAIIIFSATGGGTTEGGRIRQNIAFTAKTGIPISGGMLTDWVRIEPNGNTFTAAARFHKASGSGTFTATVTTAGDVANGLEGVTVDFSFRVLVLGVDFPHLTQSFYEFPVGAKVAVSLPVFFAAQQAQLNLPKVPSAIVSQTYGELESYTDEGHGGITRQRWVGEESGISIDPVLDGQNYVRGAGLSGIALRPGIYYRAFDISSYDNGGGYDPFPGANGSGIVIINVYDDRESPKVVVPYSHVPEGDFIRVIRHAVEGYTAARLTGEFTRSGDTWTRRVEEAISADASDIWEYRMERNAETGVWTLSGRNYRSGETVPDYAALATASGRFGGTPPNTGWSNGVLCAGDADFFVPDRGFFDRKGERTIGEFTGPVFEQQPMVAAQHAGWTNPPATRFDAGLYLAPSPDGKWRISADPAAVNGAEVETQTIQHVAIPYHPPTAGYPIAGQNYRDFALLAEQAAGNPVAVNAHLGGDVALRMGSHVAGVPSHYTWLRQLPPPVAAGTPKNITVNVTIETSSPPNESYSDQYVCLRSQDFGWNDSVNMPYVSKSWNNEAGEIKISQKFVVTIAADAWMRRAHDELSGLIGMVCGDSSAMSYEQNEKNMRRYGYFGENTAYGWIHTDWTEIFSNFSSEERPTGETGAQTGRVLMALGSGRNETDGHVNLYAAGLAGASGSLKTQRVSISYQDTTAKHTDDRGGDYENHTVQVDDTSTDGPFTRSMAAAMVSPMCHVVSMADLIFSGLTVETFSASFNGMLETVQKYDAPEGTVTTIHTTTITATHEHVSYSGENLPPGLIGRGWTHIVKTVDGVNTDTWHDDPAGSLYSGLYVDYGDEFDYDAIEMPQQESGRRVGSRYGKRNETWTRRRETFSASE